MVRYDYLPAEITPGELAAVAEANRDGWIAPPVYCSWRPQPARPWKTVHLRYLARRGLVAQRWMRRDGLLCVRLNADGMRLAGRSAPEATA